MTKIIQNFIVAGLLTLFSMIILENYDLYSNLIVFIGVFFMYYFWSWLMTQMKPRIITKESDEIEHPAIENTAILHISNIQKHYGKKYDKKLVETCNCGSKLFRIYNEDTEKGTYIQFICTKCNQKATGLEFNWKEQRKVPIIIPTGYSPKDL